MDDFYIDKILNGDKQAFRYLVQQYKDKGYNLAVSILKNTQNAEDVIQESFIKVFKNLGSFKKDAKFSTWFYRIVVNEAYMHLRKNNISFSELDGKTNKLILDVPKENEQWELAQKQLQRLPPNEALALNLFYLEEMKIKEISNITGWSISNVKVVLHRARKNIKEQINKTYEQ